MTIVTDNPGTLYLGKTGECRARTLAFREPCKWAAQFGGGVAQLLVKPPGHGKTYPVVLDQRDGMALWHVTAADTARPGYGHCELRWSVDGAVRKPLPLPIGPSVPFSTRQRLLTAIGGPGTRMRTGMPIPASPPGVSRGNRDPAAEKSPGMKI